MESVKLTGVNELHNMLKTFEDKVQRKVLKEAAKEGAGIQLRATKREVPILTGALRDSLQIKTGFKRKTSTVTATVQTGEKQLRGDQFYGHFLEFGTIHQTANPFLSRAFEKTKDAVVDKTIAALKTGIDKIARE